MHSDLVMEPVQELVLSRMDTYENENYSNILEGYGVRFKEESYFYYVGHTNHVQGWILHISVIISQFKQLLHTIIPFLTTQNVSYKLVKDKDTAKDTLTGSLGPTQLGKLVSIYPSENANYPSLAMKLVELTKPFQGPDILTDIQLGNAVFTRYGSINPIIVAGSDGKKENHIYNLNGELIKDPYHIPFQLPPGIVWPYGDWVSPTIQPKKRILNTIYKPLSLLKADLKGNVYKGIYIKGLFKVKQCVIKEGKSNMVSDETGRTIHDRLAWQYELHQELEKFVPLPKVFDLFQQERDTYLAMEFINGKSLFDRMKEINFDIKSWVETSLEQKSELLEYLLQIIDIIESLHNNGYVHRDIAPGNFLISARRAIVLIDMELAYSQRKRTPYPAFEYGTRGYMSPQQMVLADPDLKDDIFALGAVMINMFTGLLSSKFNLYSPLSPIKNIDFFIKNTQISGLIGECLSHSRSERPQLREIRSKIQKQKHDLIHTPLTTTKERETIRPEQVRSTISYGLAGLNRGPIVMLNDQWYSKLIVTNYAWAHEQKEYTRYIGLHTGMSGVLYLLGKAKRMGFNIDACINPYERSWEYIQDQLTSNLANLAPGLYAGTAGVAVSLAEGIRAGILNLDARSISTFETSLTCSTDYLDVASGLAGQGLAILQCKPYLEEKLTQRLLENILSNILDGQQKYGSWYKKQNASKNSKTIDLSFRYGTPGILWFLLSYSTQYQDLHVTESISNAFRWMFKYVDTLKQLAKNPQTRDSLMGIILDLIKGYEVSNSKSYKLLAEDLLNAYPFHIVKNNFSQDEGLAGLGELYLESWRVFKSENWFHRASWIAKVLCETFCKNGEDRGYWVTEDHSDPTADFMVGNSGIIHFLLRYLDTKNLSYPIVG